MENIKEKIAFGIFIFSIIAVLVLSVLMFQETLTGKVVEETKEQTTTEGQGQITCSDSDSRDYNIKGAVEHCDANGCSSKEDFCSGKKLTEWYCENSEAKYEEYECEDDCSEGVCLTLATKYKYVGSGGGGGGGGAASGGGTTGGAGGVSETPGQTYNLGELSSEQTLDISQYDSIAFTITGKSYLLSLTDITETEIKISYEGSELSINLGEEKNNIPGIYLKLKSINIITNKAKLSLGLV